MAPVQHQKHSQGMAAYDRPGSASANGRIKMMQTRSESSRKHLIYLIFQRCREMLQYSQQYMHNQQKFSIFSLFFHFTKVTLCEMQRFSVYSQETFDKLRYMCSPDLHQDIQNTTTMQNVSLRPLANLFLQLDHHRQYCPNVVLPQIRFSGFNVLYKWHLSQFTS